MAIKFNFTKAAIDALPTPEPGKRIDYQDTKTTGLQLRATSTGIKTFSVLRRVNGSLERITLGRYPDMKIEQARKQAGETNSAIANGANPAELKRVGKAEMTFSDLFADFVKLHQGHVKPNATTLKGYEQRIQQYVAKPVGGKKLSQIDRADFAKIHNSITRAGSPAVANRVLAIVSSVYGWAISAGLWKDNPAKGIKRNSLESRDRFIQSDELPRFFQSVADEENDTIRDYVLLSLLTGARRANVLSMRWADVNFDRAEWRIGMTKNGTPQTVTLSPEALEVLKQREETAQKGSAFVFPGTGKSGLLAPVE